MADSDELLDCLQRYQLMQQLRSQSRARVLAQPTGDYARSLFGAQKANIARINQIFDDTDEMLRDLFVVELVATFERIVFALAGTAIGAFRKAIDQTPELTPFYDFRARFISKTESIGNLGGMREILKDISVNYERIKAVIDYRDWVAHGKRFGRKRVIFSIEEAHDDLQLALRQIRGGC